MNLFDCCYGRNPYLQFASSIQLNICGGNQLLILRLLATSYGFVGSVTL